MRTLRVEADTHLTAAGDGAAAVAPAGTLEASPAPAPSQTRRTFLDLVQGAQAHHLWYLLGWQDIRRRYRRSVLGPFWLTLSMGALVSVLGLLYGMLLQVENADYVPFLALGFIVWTLISGVINDGCQTFINAQGIIKQVGLPLSIHVYRLLWRNVLILFHNALVYVVVAAVFAVWPGWVGLLALPGLVLLCLNGIWAGLLLGIVSARFRDVPPVVSSIVRICFFVTPIIWMPELVPARALVLEANPFFHLVEVVRAPLLGQAPGLESWFAVLLITCAGWLVTFAFFRRYRRRIAYWV